MACLKAKCLGCERGRSVLQRTLLSLLVAELNKGDIVEDNTAHFVTKCMIAGLCHTYIVPPQYTPLVRKQCEGVYLLCLHQERLTYVPQVPDGKNIWN